MNKTSDLIVTDYLCHSAKIVAAYVSNNKIQAEEIPDLLQRVHNCIEQLANKSSFSFGPQKPAVPIDESVTEEHIICLEDGKKMRMLKRYLKSHFDMTPEQYRKKWDLPADYPMTAPDYSKTRSKYAKASGLGIGGRKPPRVRVEKQKRDESPEMPAPAETSPTMLAQSHNGKRILSSINHH